jgi:hypothetical protein
LTAFSIEHFNGEMSRSPTFVIVNIGIANASSKDHVAVVKSHVSKQRKRKKTTEMVERLKSSSSPAGLWKSHEDSWFSPNGKELSGLRTEIDYDEIYKDDSTSSSSPTSIGLKFSPSLGARPREPDHATPYSDTSPRHYASQANPVRTIRLRAYPIRMSENAKLALQYCMSQA